MARGFTIDYSEFSAAGFGIHGVILVTRPDSVVVRSLQGLATDRKNGCAKPIGAAFLGDELRGYIDEGRSGLAASPPKEIFSGTRPQVFGRLSAMVTATIRLNRMHLPYELPGPFSVIGSVFSSSAGENVNSNSYVATMVRLIGGKLLDDTAYTTLLGRIGTRGQIFAEADLQAIRDMYGSDFLGVANRNHRCLGSQSSAGRARDHCNGFEGSNSQSLHVGA